MKENTTRYAMAPPFPSLAGAFASHPSNVSFRLPAELAHVRHGDGLSAQTILGLRLTWRTAPSDVRGDPRGSRNASLRKDGTLACSLCLKIIALPAGRTFPESRLSSTVGRPLNEDERSGGQSALSECAARVRRLSEGRGVSGQPRTTEQGRKQCSGRFLDVGA